MRVSLKDLKNVFKEIAQIGKTIAGSYNVLVVANERCAYFIKNEKILLKIFTLVDEILIK